MYPTIDRIVLETIALYKNMGTIQNIDLHGFQTPLVV
jgi:hypothetical protein